MTTEPSLSHLRALAHDLSWPAADLASHLGISRTRLFQLQRNGDQIPATLREAAITTRAHLEQLKAAADLDAAASAAALASWRVHADGWAADLAQSNRSPQTVATYRRHLGWVAADLAETHPNPWHLPEHVLEAWLEDRNWSAETRRKVLGSLRAFYSWGLLNGLCARSPLTGIAMQPRTPPGPGTRPFPPAWHKPVAAFLEHLAAGAQQPATIANRRHRLLHLASHFADPWQITASDLERYCSRSDWTPSTRRHVTVAVRVFYSWAERAGHMPPDTINPTTHLPTVRVRRAMPRPAPDDAVLAALASADARTALALKLGIYAGLRTAEVASVHTRDIGTDTLLVHGKGGHERLVPLHPDLAAALHQELRRRLEQRPADSGWTNTPPVDTWLFPSPKNPDRHLTPQYLGKLVAKALPDHWTGHTLRHRFASQAYRANRDLRAVQELLGHTKPETTAIYASVPGESMRSAVHAVGLVTL